MSAAEDALDAWEDTKRVEAAYRHQAKEAQRRYITAYRHAPRDPATDSLHRLYREAVSQWAQAQRNLERARRGWAARSRVRSRATPSGPQRGTGGARTGRDGLPVHPGAARPLEGHHGRTG